MKPKLIKNRKGYYFSLDALLAFLIILGVILFIKPSATQIITQEHLQDDFLKVLSNVKIGELNNSYAQDLITNNTITNLNQSVLEQIGEFYANSDSNDRVLTEKILEDLDLDTNIGLYFNNNLISSSNKSSLGDAEDIWTSRQLISGVDNNINASSRGFSSRAFLFSENNADYFYFGGYVGDGNITLYLGEDVVSAKIEADFSGSFNLSVNNNPPIQHNPTSGVPYEFTISNGFVIGENHLYFTSSNNLYIAGGFMKVIYNETITPVSETKYKLPGITGFINLYDSFYIPGILQSMNIFLNYTSAYKVFMTIGNETVYTGNGSNIEVTLDDSDLSVLDYSSLSYKTIPFRLGLENVSYVLNISQEADVFSVTDLSGSMDRWSGCSTPVYEVTDCDGSTPETGCCWRVWQIFTGWRYYQCDQCKISMAKIANKAFIDAVLNSSGNRVGLVGYSGSIENTHPLSDNKISLKNEIDTYEAGGWTCICCGINEAREKLVAQSSAEKFKSMVVMSDGMANVECAEQGTGDAKDDAIQAACEAYNDYNITVHAIGFGSNADTETLVAIAACGQGSFYFGGVDDLVDIYQDIAQEIINAAYAEQTIIGEGVLTELYPSSYISVDYDKAIPYGMIITAETSEFGAPGGNGNFSLPIDAIPYEVNVISYSGSKWTSKVDVYNNVSSVWETIFDLSDYGGEYTELGDPYVVNIPLNKVIQGDNSVNVSLGLSPGNLTLGSQYDKVIYSVVKNISGFSDIVASAEGCVWTIVFEDGTNSTIKIPVNYTGSDTCSYAPGDIRYNANDAIDSAVYDLLVNLDLNNNEMIETKFTEQDLTISSIEIEGIPFVWETEAQVRVWR